MEFTKWFYLKDNQQRGPVDTGDLASLIQSGILPPDTLVFTSSQADWIPANTTGVFPLKATTLTTGNNIYRKFKTALIIQLLLCLGGGLLVMQQKQNTGKLNNGRTSLNEVDQLRGKIQTTTAQSSPRKITRKQKDPKNSQSSKRSNFGNREPMVDTLTHQNQLAVLQRQYASLEAERRAAEKRGKLDLATARINEARNDDQLAKANISRLKLKQLLEESREHNTKLNHQIKMLEKQNQIGRQANTKLAEANKTHRELERRLVAANQLNTNLLQRVKIMEINNQENAQNNAKLTEKLNKASKELEAARKKIPNLKQQLQGTQLGETTLPQQSHTQPTPKVPSAAVGNISYVDTRSKFIVINRGSNNNIKNGDTFRIISHSTGEFLGRITIKKTDPSIAGGTLDGQGIGQLRSGDLLFR
jgi:hypothetical protein